MPDQYNRRSFLAGVLACGTLTAAAGYVLQSRPAPDITLRLATGDDDTGAREHLVNLWNDRHPHVKLTLQVVESETGGQKRVMRNDAAAGTVDIVNLDVIHVPEFAADGLIQPIELAGPNEFLDPLLEPVRNADSPGTHWAAPFNTDVGMLFQRHPDGTGAELVTLAEVLSRRGRDGTGQFVGQLAPQTSTSREVFVVNVLEHALAQDPEIVSPDGVLSDSLEDWTRALRPLHDYVRSRGAPLASDSDDTLRRFEGQRLPYMRNWPVKYREFEPIAQTGETGVVIRPLPIGILGGQYLAVVKKSRHPVEAARAIAFLTDTPAQTALAMYGLAPTRMGAYDHANTRRLLPHLEAVRGAVEGSRPRPVHRNYGAFSDSFAVHIADYLKRDKPALSSDLISDMKIALAPGR